MKDIVLMIMYIYILQNILNKNKKIFLLSFIIGMLLIFASASTGMILAMGSFIAIQILYNIKKIFYMLKVQKTKIIVTFIIISMIASFGILMYIFDETIKLKVNNFYEKNIMESSIYTRIASKLDKIGGESLLEDRNLDQIINNPQYLFFGGGQGEYGRFTNYTYNGEIHSTLPSIMFYYGIIPTVILLYWIYTNIKGLNMKYMSVYIAIAIESFTLLNQRQLLLWVLILLGTIINESECKHQLLKKEEKCEEDL